MFLPDNVVPQPNPLLLVCNLKLFWHLSSILGYTLVEEEGGKGEEEEVALAPTTWIYS